MEKNLSDFSLSIIILYEELLNYLISNKKIKLLRVPMNKKSKIGEKIRENNKTKKVYSEFINYFEYIIRSRFPKEVLHNFDDNISDFKIYGTCFQLADFLKKIVKYAGVYYPTQNMILLNIKDEESDLSIYHELFHMASTNRMITNRVQTGFSVSQNGIITGRGLNEGYTDFISNRYFGNVGYKIGYPLEYQYASAIEKIVGREKMENLYMASNPRQLVKELERYDQQDNIIHFIKLLDTINDPKESIVIRNGKLNSITSLLIQWYVRKNIMEGENILDPSVMAKINSFAWQLPAKIINLNNSGATYIDINSIVNDVINEYVNSNLRYSRR